MILYRSVKVKAPKEVSLFTITAFFVIGLFSSLCFRLILIAGHVYPESVRFIWYCGVVGYLVFFLYRAKIAVKRRKTVRDFDLIRKIEESQLDESDKQAVTYILNSILISKEVLNYIIIFLLSGLAIIIDLWMTYQSL